jgi:hypothetical protein
MMRIKEGSYIPEIFDNGNRVKLMAQLSSCFACGRKMIMLNKSDIDRVYHLFPYYFGDTLQAQLKRANITWYGNVKDKDDEFLCEDCSNRGLGEFVCSLCGETRSSDLKEESFGIDPPRHLCKICYETVSAKTWKEKSDSLTREHRWDWE